MKEEKPDTISSIAMFDSLRSLIYALNTTLGKRRGLEKKLIIIEFIHSMNRKGYIANSDVEPTIKEAIKQIEAEK
jgi:DNA-binding winged helix-turn-helix (wHTH) protein